METPRPESAVAYRETVPSNMEIAAQEMARKNIEEYLDDFRVLLASQSIQLGSETDSETHISFVFHEDDGHLMSVKKRNTGLKPLPEGRYEGGGLWGAFVLKRVYAKKNINGREVAKLKGKKFDAVSFGSVQPHVDAERALRETMHLLNKELFSSYGQEEG